jgi:hypothetical protein
VTKGTRPKKPSSFRGFTGKARGARGFWGLKTKNRKPKTENCKFFLSFQAGNNYEKKFITFFIFFNLFFIFLFFHVRADSKGEGVRGGRGGEGCASVRTPMSARTMGCVRADAHVRADAGVRPCGRECFIPGNFKKDAIVRPSHRCPCGHRLSICPFVRPLSSA